MAGARARIFGLMGLVAFGMAAFCLLLYACAHWHNWWSLFVVAPCFLAIALPGGCHGYEPQDMVNTEMDPETFRTCRELGWASAALLWLAAYGVPVLAWYNSGFPWRGVLVVEGAITSAEWSFILWVAFFAVRRQ